MRLTNEALKYIRDNAGVIKQKEIAAKLNVTPACICKVLKREQKRDNYFNIDEFKYYYRW